MNVAMNKKGYESFENVLNNGMRALSAAEFETAAEETGALILDTRKNTEFWKGFVPQSVNIGLYGDFAPWVGALIADVKQPLLLITDVGMEEETVTRLSRVGFDNLLGHLKGGIQTWIDSGKETDKVNRISAAQFAAEFKAGESKVVDIRRENEYETKHISEADSKPLANINEWVKDINPAQHFYIHCAAGYRSMAAASILQARGYRNFTEIEGGFNAIAKTDIPKSDFVSQNN